MPIDRSEADVWVASRDVLSLELAHPIPDDWEARVASQPEVELTETYLFSFGYWHKPTGGSEVCEVIGTQLGEQALGAAYHLLYFWSIFQIAIEISQFASELAKQI